MTTVAIVDDHSVVRMGMKYVLMTDKEFKFVGEADDGAEAVSLVEKYRPDILLLDVRMPGTDGIAALKAVRETFPDQKVVMLTMSDAEEDVYQALSLGARGYVIKDNSPGNIIGALGPSDVFILLAKSILPGMLTGACCCEEGLSVGHTFSAVPIAAARGVIRSIAVLLFISVLISVAAYL